MNAISVEARLTKNGEAIVFKKDEPFYHPHLTGIGKRLKCAVCGKYCGVYLYWNWKHDTVEMGIKMLRQIGREINKIDKRGCEYCGAKEWSRDVKNKGLQ